MPQISESTVVSSIHTDSGGNIRDIYVGHLNELHYVSTIPFTQYVNETANSRQTLNKPKVCLQSTEFRWPDTNKKLERRKKYMKKYMKKGRKDSDFKKRESERKSPIIENIRILILKKSKKPMQHTDVSI